MANFISTLMNVFLFLFFVLFTKSLRSQCYFVFSKLRNGKKRHDVTAWEPRGAIEETEVGFVCSRESSQLEASCRELLWTLEVQPRIS